MMRMRVRKGDCTLSKSSSAGFVLRERDSSTAFLKAGDSATMVGLVDGKGDNGVACVETGNSRGL